MGRFKHVTNSYVIYRVKINQIRTARLRGYILDDEDDKLLNMSEEEFVEYYTNKASESGVDFFLSMNKLYKRYVDENGDPSTEGNVESNYFYFIPMGDEKTICIEKVNPVVNFAVRADMDQIDIISHAPLHAWSTGALSRLKNKRFVLWTYENMMIFPFDCECVPKYHIMTREEKQKTFYGDDGKPLIKRSKLVSMMLNDPVVKFIGAKLGDILSFVEEQNYVPSLVNERLSFRVIVPGTVTETTKRNASDPAI